jgi:NAD(P)-dependent dehydrogenase (short-subunit alcohol dehydrogenase family)
LEAALHAASIPSASGAAAILAGVLDPSLPGLFDVQGKVALVTGGSRGVGLMIAGGLVEAGATVLISSRKVPDCEAAAAQLNELGAAVTAQGGTGGVAIAIPGDVSSAAGVAALVDTVRIHTERLDLLVNNAGATWGAPLDDFPESGWDKVMDTNVKSIFALTTAVLDLLRAGASADGPARVINIGSVDGLRVPLTENYSYSASKAAVHMLTRHLAKRLASENITVNAIAPGPFESKMTAFVLDHPEGRAGLEAMIPLGRIGRASDLVGLTLLLSSRAGAYMTGTILPLDGGITGCA